MQRAAFLELKDSALVLGGLREWSDWSHRGKRGLMGTD